MPPCSTDRTSYPSASCRVSPNRTLHPLRLAAKPMGVLHVNPDLRHPLVFQGYLDSEPEARHSLVEDHSIYPGLRHYQPPPPPEVLTTSPQSLLPRMASRKSKVKRPIERYSSVSDPRKNKTTGTTSSGVWLVHDNQVQRGVIVVCPYLSLISMKLGGGIEGAVMILLHPCIPKIDQPRRVVECRMARPEILQVWTREA